MNDDDDIVERLRELPPPLADVPDRIDRIEERVVRRGQWRAVTATAAAVALIAGGVSLAFATQEDRPISSLGPAPSSPALPSGDAVNTRPPVAAGEELTCPSTFEQGPPEVPEKPRGLDGESRLVPRDLTPTAALVCAYNGNNTGSGNQDWDLSGRKELRGDLTPMVELLTWVPRQLPGEQQICTLIGGPQTNLLLGLTYPQGGRIWISTAHEPNNCVKASNGDFMSSLGFGRQLNASYEAGRWEPDPGPPDYQLPDTPSPCRGGPVGRLGQETQMVPETPTSMLACEERLTSDDTTYREVTVKDFSNLIVALNGGPTVPSQSRCDPVGKEPNRSFEVRFGYAEGPDVLVRVWPRCVPEVDNSSLTLEDGSEAIAILEGYFD